MAEAVTASAGEGNVLKKMLSSVSEALPQKPHHTIYMTKQEYDELMAQTRDHQHSRSLIGLALGKLGAVVNPITYIPSISTIKKAYGLLYTLVFKYPLSFTIIVATSAILYFSTTARERIGGIFASFKDFALVVATLAGNFFGNIKDYIADRIPRPIKHGFRAFQNATKWITEQTIVAPFKTLLATLLEKITTTWPFSIIAEKYADSQPMSALDPRSKYAGGDSSGYDDPKKLSTGIANDLKALGKSLPGNANTLLQVGFAKGKPQDDKKMIMEKMIALTASLPITSKARHKLSCTIIETLWDSLQHPPLSYYGEKFQYRTADGSYNNVMNPDLGRAGTAYARSVRSQKKLHGVRPDPGVLFDLLMARPDDPAGFKENPAGISAVLFAHASIIIHDIFRTNRLDSNVSDTSSYLDLAPLYGSSVAEQAKVRTFSKGLLKPDTFHEKRLLGQPACVNTMLVFYSRFHNYAADVLLKINEGGRFTLRGNTEEALLKQDNDLFQTARLVTGGLYMNICLHDYLRGLTNAHHSKTDWTLDPRIEIGNEDLPGGVPRGTGNQVSAEFNLLYRFHSVISQRDEKWLNDFFKSLFPGLNKPLSALTPQELVQGLLRFEASIDPEPSKRTFAGLQRGPDGRFKDEDLVRVMKEAIEDPAGLFGPRMVPKALRVVEILGILQARKWGVASLNEFRDFFGLKRHETFEDITDNEEVQYILKNLYDHPDMVELYPGLFLEDGKPRLDPGCGGCPPYTVGRAVFSDAVTLVRSDRFYTIDYTANTLTNWGMQEVQQDYETLGGSMLYKLIQRAVPGWFPYNSLHVMQPMFTKNMNRTIAKEIGTYSLYTEADPAPPAQPQIVVDPDTTRKILLNQRSFVVPWAKAMNDVFPGVKDYSGFMLGGDQAANTAMRNLVGDAVYQDKDVGVKGAVKKLFFDYVVDVGKKCLTEDLFDLGPASQIDIVRDLAIPADTKLMADLFCLDLIDADEHPNGSLTIPQMYQALLDFRIWGFNNNDPAKAWNRRRRAAKAAKLLTKTTERMVANVKGKSGAAPTSFIAKVASWFEPRTHISGLEPREGGLRWYGEHVVQELLAAGKTVAETAEILWLTAVAGVGVPVAVFTEVLQYFLQVAPDRWGEIQKLAAENSDAADARIRLYVQEAQRITSSQRNVRFVKEDATIGDRTFKRGQAVILMLGIAGRHPSIGPDPNKFVLDRPKEAYLSFGYGPHECLGRELTMIYCTALLKVTAGLKNLRPAPGAMGELKQIEVNRERCYLTSDWASLTFDPTTWKLHCDGYGAGVHQPDSAATIASAGQGLDSGAIASSIVEKNPALKPDKDDTAHTGASDADIAAPIPGDKTQGSQAPPAADAGKSDAKPDQGSVSGSGSLSKEQLLRIPVCTTFSLPDGQWQLLAEEERQGQSAKRGTTWRLGSNIKVRFLNGSESMHKKYAAIAREKERYGNFRFQFDDVADAHIRVMFNKNEGMFSYIGTDCKAIVDDKPTSNCPLDENSTDEDWSRLSNHIIGHTLGIPGALPCDPKDIKWNEDFIRSYHKTLYPVSLSLDEGGPDRTLDIVKGVNPRVAPRPGSCMTEAIPPQFTADGSGQHAELGTPAPTEADNGFLKLMYPYPAENQGWMKGLWDNTNKPIKIAGGILGIADDDIVDASFPIDLPFEISLFGQKSSRVSVSTNGAIRLLLSGENAGPEPYLDGNGTTLYPFWDTDFCIRRDTREGIYMTTNGEGNVKFSFGLSKRKKSGGGGGGGYSKKKVTYTYEFYSFSAEFSSKTPDIVTVTYNVIPDSGARASIGAQSDQKHLDFSRDGAKRITPAGVQVVLDTTEKCKGKFASDV